MNLKNGIIELFSNNSAKEAFYGISEVALDSITDDGLLKDIPVIGTLVKSGQAIFTIKDRLFIKKIESFLRPLDNVSLENKSRFFRELDSKEMREKTGERLLLILDRQDDLDKAEIIGWIFKEYVIGEIDEEEFRMLCHSISISYLGEIEWIDKYSKDPDFLDDSIGNVLVSSGLATFKIDIVSMDLGGLSEEDSGHTESKNKYKLTDLGEKLAKIVAKRNANKA